MIKANVYQFNPVKLIEEVKKRPGLYSLNQPAERDEKLQLWKEIGAALYADWDNFNKATAYDRVLTLQRKWRSLRDAYNRELRQRRTGQRNNRRVYMYFKRMSFLGGFDGDISEDEDVEIHEAGDVEYEEYQTVTDPLSKTKPRKRNKRPKRSTSPENNEPYEENLTAYPIEITEEGESDKLFLLSFLPEMRQLPLNIKMWARVKIANIMQEAVVAHYNNTVPNKSSDTVEVKLQRRESGSE